LKGTIFVSLLLLAAPLASYASEQLVPAGSVIQCMVAEPKINSKTEAIGDPVLCSVSHVELYGRTVFPWGSYLEGRFEDYKDPGHFVGKGWMELKFDRLVVGNEVVPASAKVVYVPKYPVDKEGRIHGTGHPVRDAVEWAIPVLWPLDLINLPRRGPRPTLKAETRLTIKIMDDLVIPSQDEYAERQGLISRSAPPPQPQYQQPQYPQPYPQQYQQPYPQQYPQTYVPPPPPRPVYQYTAMPSVVYVAPPVPMFVAAPVVYGYVPAPAPATVAVPAGYVYGPYGPMGMAVYRPRMYGPY
jgi:hypothetical protein